MISRDRQRGSMSVELAALTPLLILFAMLMVLGGRVTRAEATADEVAHSAARAASLERAPEQAEAAAGDTVVTALDSHGLACSDHTLTLDHGGLSAGGAVTATLQCHVGLGDLAGMRLPGTHTVEGESTAVVDTFRGQP